MNKYVCFNSENIRGYRVKRNHEGIFMMMAIGSLLKKYIIQNLQFQKLRVLIFMLIKICENREVFKVWSPYYMPDLTINLQQAPFHFPHRAP